MPPDISYFVNYDDTMGSANRDGTIGDVAVYRVDCKDPSCTTEPETGVVTEPPAMPMPSAPPSSSSAPSSPGGPGSTTNTGTEPCVGPNCNPPCVGPDCNPPCVRPDCNPPCVGDDCRPHHVCLKADGQVVCDPQSGGWIVKLLTHNPGSLNINALTAYATAPAGVSVANGPQISLVPPPAIIALAGAIGGQTVTIDVCGYNAAAAKTGRPYDCCRATLTVKIPNGECKPAGQGSTPR